MPAITWTDALLKACAEKWHSLQEGNQGPDCPKWIFLQYLVDHEGLLLHGSQNHGITAFEPRVAGNQFKDGQLPRVYASSSSLLSCWYAIVDRDKLKEICGAVQFGMTYAPVHPLTKVKGARHFFAVGHLAYSHKPFHSGVVYILPRESFTPEYLELQWYAEKAVRPLASMRIDPIDWPMMHTVRAMDFAKAIAKSKSDPDGKIPPLDDLDVFPKIGTI